MDPEGVREVFFAECGAAPDYGVRNAIRSVPFPCRSKDSYFFGLHLPLTYCLPKRLDFTLQQTPGLHTYDAILLVDIDPSILDADDLLNLLAYVEAGGGLLMMAGPNSFSRAQRGWGPLCEALPVNIPLRPARSKTETGELTVSGCERRVTVRPMEPHPVSSGLSSPLGSTFTFNPVTAKDGSVVIAAAESEPIVVAGTYGAGRVLMINAVPQSDAPDCMYRTPGWSDLLRQGLSWLMKRDGDLVVTDVRAEVAPLPAAETRSVTLTLAGTSAGGFETRADAALADPGWLAAGREPQFGDSAPLAVRTSETTVEAGFAPDRPGLWRVRVRVEGDGWANVRILHVNVPSPAGLSLSARNGEYVSAPGRVFPLRLASDRPVSAHLSITDFDGVEVWQQENAQPGNIDITLPQLELGEYEIRADAADDSARLRFCLTDETRRTRFSLVANAYGATEEKVRWWYDHFRERGFDAFATSLAEDVAAPVPGTFRPAAYQHYLVQRDGLDLWGEYIGATLLKYRSVYGEEGTNPTTPCVLDPAHETRLREFLGERFRAAEALPRMISLEILDEPHFYRANVCRCDRCLEAFKSKHGYAMPTWDEALAAKDQCTRDYFEWVVNYAANGFRMGHEIWKSFGPGPHLHHVLCAIGAGDRSVANTVAQDLAYAQHADFIEFDCYNYMYPHWRPLNKLRWNEFHYLMGHFRFLALRNRQRFGFFIQVTDRDLPVAPADPLRAPSETLYAAIGGGAKTFHLMAKGPFTNTQNCREEKFDAFAQDIRKVQRIAPLLDRAERPRSRIAMIAPFHDRLYRYPKHRLPEGYQGLGYYGREYRPIDTLWPYHQASINVAELLFRVFGEIDVIDQCALREGALDDYGGFILATTDYMATEDADAVVRFVEGGGSLICDHTPTHNTTGELNSPLTPLFAGREEPLYRDIRLRRSDYGKGRTLLLSTDLNELYTAAVERDDEPLQNRLKAALRDFLFEAGLRPHVAGSDEEIEANLLVTPDTQVLVAVNHAEDRRRSELTVYSPGAPVNHVCDLVTMKTYDFRCKDGHVSVDIDLGEREGLILGLYPAVPASIAVTPVAPRAERGGVFAFDVELRDARGDLPRGDVVVEVCVTDAGGTERHRFGGLRCATNGSLRIEGPLAVNARRGTWLVTVFERFSGMETTAEIEVS